MKVQLKFFLFSTDRFFRHQSTKFHLQTRKRNVDTTRPMPTTKTNRNEIESSRLPSTSTWTRGQAFSQQQTDKVTTKVLSIDWLY